MKVTIHSTVLSEISALPPVTLLVTSQRRLGPVPLLWPLAALTESVLLPPLTWHTRHAQLTLVCVITETIHHHYIYNITSFLCWAFHPLHQLCWSLNQLCHPCFFSLGPLYPSIHLSIQHFFYHLLDLLPQWVHASFCHDCSGRESMVKQPWSQHSGFNTASDESSVWSFTSVTQPQSTSVDPLMILFLHQRTSLPDQNCSFTKPSASV